MKLIAPKNNNYCATVVKLKAIVPLENCDNVVGSPIFGFQAIVQKDHQIGDIGIVFPAETQLSEEYCKQNNLYRHTEKNKDTNQAGYIEDNRRIKSVKFRGQRSDCLFMPLDSLAWTGVKITDFKEGDEFDELNGKAICNKYVIRSFERKNRVAQPKRFNRVDTKFIPEHMDSDNYFKFSGLLNPEAEVIVTQKLHGTSIRIANTIVKRKLKLHEHAAKFLRIKVQETEFDYVFGSRKVIKDINNPFHNHFYDVDIWTLEGKKLEGIIPENYLIYGELIGYTPTGAAIQKDYTYQIPEGQCELYVYRVAIVNGQGLVTDLSWDHVKEFCSSYGLKSVPEIWRGKAKDLEVTQFLDTRLNDSFRGCLALDDEKLVDEGVCVRVDKITPYILKAKSPVFLQHESKLLDTGEMDLETEGSISE